MDICSVIKSYFTYKFALKTKIQHLGYDFAFARNGYRYHTKYDGFSNIPLESYQHVGDNILFLLRGLGDAPELLNHDDSQGKIVYYDFIGLFIVAYPEHMGLIINGIVVIFSFVIFAISFRDLGFRKFFSLVNKVKNICIRCIKLIFFLGLSKINVIYTFFVFVAILSGWVLSGCFIAIIATLLDCFNSTMSWYKNPWIVLGLYCVPVVLSSSFMITLFNRFNQKVK